MSNKYHGLPDIDTAPDVFETRDEPDPILRPNDGGLESDDPIVKHHSDLIDATELPGRRKAERVFGRGKRRQDLSDFTHRPRLQTHRHSRASSSSDEDLPRETTSARIRRLKAELAQVEQEIHKGLVGGQKEIGHSASRTGETKKESLKADPPGRGTASVVEELAGLRARLEKLDVHDSHATQPSGKDDDTLDYRLQKLTSRSQLAADGSVTAEQTEDRKPGGSLTSIDQRLAILETLIGPSDGAASTASPLLSTLNKHDHLLALLTQPRHLDAISRRVKLLLVDLDRAAAAARRQGASTTHQPSDKSPALTTAEYATLQSLFAILPRLDPLLPVIPALLTRMQSLAGLHTAAGEVADGVFKLRDGGKGEAEELAELTSGVEGVQRGLDDASKQVLENWSGIEKKLKELEARVETLGI